MSPIFLKFKSLLTRRLMLLCDFFDQVLKPIISINISLKIIHTNPSNTSWTEAWLDDSGGLIICTGTPCIIGWHLIKVSNGINMINIRLNWFKSMVITNNYTEMFSNEYASILYWFWFCAAKVRNDIVWLSADQLLMCLLLCIVISPPNFWGLYIKGILCDFYKFTLEQIIAFNKYCTHNKPIPKISHVKTLQNLCKMRYKKKKIRK